MSLNKFGIQLKAFWPPPQLTVSRKFVKMVKQIFFRQTSAFILVLGRRETGKSDFSLLLSEILFHRCKIKHFATNMHIYNSGDLDFKKIVSLDALREWCQFVKGRKLFIFDEVGKAIRRRSPMSSLNVKLIDELQVLRKYKLSIIAIAPASKFVDSSILGTDMLDGYFKKPYRFRDMRKNQKMAIYVDLLEGKNTKLFGIPKSNLIFDTYGTAPFTEHSKVKQPAFKNYQNQRLWNWAHGEEYDCSRMTINRLSKKFVRLAMEKGVTL